MRARAVCFSVLLIMALVQGRANAESTYQFPDATETVEELIELYSENDSQCRLARERDVKVAVACFSRGIYGMAVNEKGWCFGAEDQANADMEWHRCGENSMRFPKFSIPDW